MCPEEVRLKMLGRRARVVWQRWVAPDGSERATSNTRKIKMEGEITEMVPSFDVRLSINSVCGMSVCLSNISLWISLCSIIGGSFFLPFCSVSPITLLNLTRIYASTKSEEIKYLRHRHNYVYSFSSPAFKPFLSTSWRRSVGIIWLDQNGSTLKNSTLYLDRQMIPMHLPGNWWCPRDNSSTPAIARDGPNETLWGGKQYGSDLTLLLQRWCCGNLAGNFNQCHRSL